MVKRKGNKRKGNTKNNNNNNAPTARIEVIDSELSENGADSICCNDCIEIIETNTWDNSEVNIYDEVALGIYMVVENDGMTNRDDLGNDGIEMIKEDSKEVLDDGKSEYGSEDEEDAYNEEEDVDMEELHYT